MHLLSTVRFQWAEDDAGHVSAAAQEGRGVCCRLGAIQPVAQHDCPLQERTRS